MLRNRVSASDTEVVPVLLIGLLVGIDHSKSVYLRLGGDLNKHASDCTTHTTVQLHGTVMAPSGTNQGRHFDP